MEGKIGRGTKEKAGKEISAPIRAVLVFGAPCSGKTTFCEKFAKRFGAPYYDLGEIKKQYGLSRKVLMIILEQIAKTGQMLVLEGAMDTEKERNEIKRVLIMSGYQPTLIWVQTDIGTIRTRLKFRTKSVQKAKEEYDNGINRMEAPSDAECPIVLSGKHTFETQLRHVLTQIR